MTGEQIIKLGKTLVDQLDTKDGSDLLSEWISHHIAELLAAYDREKGSEKVIAQQKCFEAILALWKQRAIFPKGRKPFENFDSILEVMDAINPNNPKPYYYRESPNPNGPQLTEKSTDLNSLVALARNLDVAARELVKYIFVQAISNAVDSKTKKYLEACSDVADDKDVYTVRLMVEPLLEEVVETELEKSIKRLDAFISIGKIARKDFALQLKKSKNKFNANK